MSSQQKCAETPVSARLSKYLSGKTIRFTPTGDGFWAVDAFEMMGCGVLVVSVTQTYRGSLSREPTIEAFFSFEGYSVKWVAE